MLGRTLREASEARSGARRMGTRRRIGRGYMSRIRWTSACSSEEKISGGGGNRRDADRMRETLCETRTSLVSGAPTKEAESRRLLPRAAPYRPNPPVHGNHVAM